MSYMRLKYRSFINYCNAVKLAALIVATLGIAALALGRPFGVMAFIAAVILSVGGAAGACVQGMGLIIFTCPVCKNDMASKLRLSADRFDILIAVLSGELDLIGHQCGSCGTICRPKLLLPGMVCKLVPTIPDD